MWNVLRACIGIAVIGTSLPAANRTVLLGPANPFWAQAAPASYRVRIETTKGAFVLEATRALAPHGADRFYNLVRARFYDDSRFYRVIAGRFVQFGIAGDPAVSAIWRDRRIPPDPERAGNVRGSFCAMPLHRGRYRHRISCSASGGHDRSDGGNRRRRRGADTDLSRSEGRPQQRVQPVNRAVETDAS